MCGAASLAMVYRSLGKTVSQAEIWPQISKRNHLGSLAAATYLMTQDALTRGFAALAIQARHPFQALRLCRDKGIRAVLSHRLKEDAPTGHYTVFVDTDGENVILHDPYFGPSRRTPQAELLGLWQARYPNAEIAGNVLIAIAGERIPVLPCPVCGTEIPPAIPCAACGKSVPLEPAALLGCVGVGCSARTWNAICCPFCDYTWTFGVQRASERQTAGHAEDPWNLEHLFGELDKFCNHISGVPGAASRADVRQQLDFIQASKAKLVQARADEVVYRKASQAKMRELQQTAKQNEEALLRKQEEINRPAPPLDGNALGLALLKNFGLLG